MKSTKTQRYILYSIGKWVEEANEYIKDRPLQVAISKTSFIELVLNAGFAKKQKRALYKNLENLEKKRFLIYQNKELMLTKKGERLYKEISKELDPYLNVYKKLKEKPATSYTKKVQTVFK
jgi:hypothetical protein